MEFGRSFCNWLSILGTACLLIAITETVGKIIFGFPQIPYLTANIVGPFDYALAYAIGLSAVGWGLKAVLGIEDPEEATPQSHHLLEESPPPAARWTCVCGRSNPRTNFNCATCGTEQPPLFVEPMGIERDAGEVSW